MANGFEITSHHTSGSNRKLVISSQTISRGDLLDLDVGAVAWTTAAASSVHFTRKAIALESATTSDTLVLARELDGTERVAVDSNATADAGDNGDRMLLTDKNTVANTGSDVSFETACFIQDGILTKDTTKKIVGRVLVGNGVNPDSHTS